MARYRVDTTTDLSKHGYWLQVRCKCGNNRKLSPARLMHVTKGHDAGGRLDKIEAKLRCGVCGGRPCEVSLCLPPKDGS